MTPCKVSVQAALLSVPSAVLMFAHSSLGPLGGVVSSARAGLDSSSEPVPHDDSETLKDICRQAESHRARAGEEVLVLCGVLPRNGEFIGVPLSRERAVQVRRGRAGAPCAADQLWPVREPCCWRRSRTLLADTSCSWKRYSCAPSGSSCRKQRRRCLPDVQLRAPLCCTQSWQLSRGSVAPRPVWLGS